MSRQAALGSLAAVCVLLMGVACGSAGGSSGASSPSAPQNVAATFIGTWTGTLSRPAGLAAIPVTWTATQDSFNLSGLFKMTNGGTSVTGTLSGPLGGGNSTGGLYQFNFSISGPSSGCSIKTSGAVVTSLAPSATSMTSNSFNITYGDCTGLVDNDPQRTQHTELTQLSLTKQ